MASGRIEYKIDDNSFYIRRFEPFLALQILGDLQKTFLGPMSTFLQSKDASQEVGMKEIVEAIEKLSRTMDGSTLVLIAKKLLDPDYVSVAIGNEPAVKLDQGAINRSMAGIEDILMLVIEVVKVNYTGLFTRGKSLIGQVQSNTERQLVS